MEHTPRLGLTYLTVQDVLWLNLRLLNTASPFRYAALEEAVNTQYAYGGSQDVHAQAARFLVGFAKRAPFDAGNEATGLAATLAFLLVNGQSLTLPDSEAGNWYGKVLSGAVQPEKAIEIAVGSDPGHAFSSVEDAMQHVLKAYRETLATLVSPTAGVAV